MALLWNPENWARRLAELEAQAGDLKEAPLRRDVRSLGTLLGAVLREQAGEEAFAQVEALRQGLKQTHGVFIQPPVAHRRPLPEPAPWVYAMNMHRCR